MPMQTYREPLPGSEELTEGQRAASIGYEDFVGVCLTALDQ
jgi:hypothetical protein